MTGCGTVKKTGKLSSAADREGWRFCFEEKWKEESKKEKSRSEQTGRRSSLLSSLDFQLFTVVSAP